ncbi:MAG: tetratricopeptide repeat protein [Bacteroidetes bacterium]|nr:tetratricopeptide repeat protein [Bacteroidota bacterium]
MLLKKIILLLVLIISFFQVHSQTSTLDSLKIELKNAKADTTRISVMLSIGYESWQERQSYWDTIIAESTIALTKNKNPIAQQRLLESKGNAYTMKGFMYEQFGQAIKALENYLISLKIQETIHDNEDMIMTLINIGMLYLNQDNHVLALDYFNKSILLNKKEVGDSITLYKGYNNIAAVYEKQLNHKKSLEYNFISLNIAKKIAYSNGVALSLYNIGVAYSGLKDETKAIEYYENGLKKMEELKDNIGISYSFYGLGRSYFKQENIQKALVYGEKSLALAKEINNLDAIKNTSSLLFDIYKKQGKYKDALEMHELHIATRDSVNNVSTRKQTLKKQFQYEYDKKEVEVKAIAKAEKEKIELKAAEDRKRQNMIIYSVIAGLLLVSIFSIFIFRGLQKNKKANKIITQQNKIVEEKNHLIEEKQKEIIDSINYAQRIQRSLLANKELLDENLDNYFILFKPKDIVSGDFYWASKLNNDHFALVTADSTGHGVPGAIMSMLNIACLNEAISNGFTSPNEILFETRLRVIEHLKNDGSASGGKDGMDCSLLCIDNKNKILYAAAANNPVWIIRATEIIEIKPDKMPVGKHDKDTEAFTLHTIQLLKNDVIYTLTDGFPDQFGGEKGKKFMSKNLKELLKTNANLPLAEQKQLLETAFNNWTGALEQIDDVTIIGIKI